MSQAAWQSMAAAHAVMLVLDAELYIRRPEFLDRIDEVVLFFPPDGQQALEITNRLLEKLRVRCLEKGISLSFSDAAARRLCQKGFDRHGGARQLRRVIRREAEDRLSELLLRGALPAGAYVFDTAEDGFTVRRRGDGQTVD